GRRPDHDRLALAVGQREAHEERGIRAILIDAGLRQLVLRERRAAARAPPGRAVAHEEPSPLVDDLQEPPDVLDVRVAEREVVVAPVHPLAEALRGPRQLRRRPDHALAALTRAVLETVLLDLALRVEPELALDPNPDPEALAVEAVLVALVEAAQALVALEDVLQRPPPGGVDAERLVRRHRPVDERPPRPAAVPPAQLLEGALALPGLEDLELERRVIGLVGQLVEHVSIVASAPPGDLLWEQRHQPRRLAVCTPRKTVLKGTDGNQRNDRYVRDRGPGDRRQGDRRFLGRMVRAVSRGLAGPRPHRRRA